MTQQNPEHYTPQYINPNQARNPFSPSYGLGGPQQRVVVVSKKSIVIAYVLWFFLGYFGIHKFYLRQPIMGLFYLFLFGVGSLTAGIIIGWPLLGLGGLLWFIDAFTMPIRIGIMNSLAQNRAMYGGY